MKILMINYEYPPLGGGAANASFYVSKGLVKFGCKITLLTSHLRGLPYFERQGGIDIKRLPVGRKNLSQSSLWEVLRFFFASLIEAVKFAKANKHFVALAYFTIPSGLVGLFLKIFYKIPYIVSLRGADVPGAKGRILNVLHFLLLPLTVLVWKRASFLIANSKGMASLVKAIYSHKKMVVIPNGVDLRIFGKDKKTRSLNDSIVRILYTGRLEENKGVRDLLSLADFLRKNSGVKFEMVLVGDGPEMGFVKSKIRELKIAPFIKLLGWVEKEKMAKIYHQACIFVMPSRYEGMSNSVLEALASGLPVVGYDIPGNNELIKNEYNGFLIPLGNLNTFMEWVLFLMANRKDREIMGANSLKIAKKYDWEKVSEKFYDILKKV